MVYLKRNRKEILEYLDEAFDKVWYMRSHPCKDKNIEKRRKEAIKNVLGKYPEVQEYDNWDCGFYNGVLGTLRWVLGDDEKDNLDT